MYIYIKAPGRIQQPPQKHNGDREPPSLLTEGQRFNSLEVIELELPGNQFAGNVDIPPVYLDTLKRCWRNGGFYLCRIFVETDPPWRSNQDKRWPETGQPSYPARSFYSCCSCWTGEEASAPSPPIDETQ